MLFKIGKQSRKYYGKIGGWVKENVFDPIERFFSETIKKIEEKIDSLPTWLKVPLTIIWYNIKNVFTTIYETIHGRIEAVKQIFRGMVQVIKSLFNGDIKRSFKWI